MPLFGRLVLLGTGFLSLVAYVAAGGANTGTDALTWVVSAVVVAAIAFNVYLFRLLQRSRAVEWVGMAGAYFDAGLLFVFLGLAIWAGTDDRLPTAYVFKTELPMTYAAMVVINGLALRPRYPLIVGGAALTAMAVLVTAMMIDARTEYSVDRVAIFAGSAVDLSQVLMIVAMLACVVAATGFTAYAARKTIRQGIATELELARLEEAQLRVVMQEKVSALGRLVAGVSHELNSPLGVMQSGLDTQSRVLDRIQKTLGDQEASVGKLIRVSRDGLAGLRTAAERIAALEISLRSLAHLDEGEVQQVDLRSELEAVVAAARREVGYEGEVSVRFGELPSVRLDAAAMSQALLAIVAWVLRASGRERPVVILADAGSNEVSIEVVGGAKIYSRDELNDLFEVRFDGSGARVRTDIALAAARAAALRHEGAVHAEAVETGGVRFVVRLPVERSTPA